MPVIVNDVEITDEAVFTEMQYHPSFSAEEAQYKAALALTIRELLLQEAASMEIEVPDNTQVDEVEEDFIISRLLEHKVITPQPDEISCQRYYEQNHSKFLDKEQNLINFENVQAAIAAYLKEMSWQMAVKQYIKILIGKARIAGIKLEGATNPLVQ